MPSLPIPQRPPELAQVHVHCICDAVQPSHPLIQVISKYSSSKLLFIQSNANSSLNVIKHAWETINSLRWFASILDSMDMNLGYTPGDGE